MESLRKSFKSVGSNSFKHMKKKSLGGGEEERHESQPILLYDNESQSSHESNKGEVVVKIDGNGTRDVELAMDSSSSSSIDHNKHWRETGYDGGGGGGGNDTMGGGGGGGYNFLQKGVGGDDPPTKLIGQFLNKQKSEGVVSLDMDLDMDELHHDRLPPIAESPSHGPNSSSREVRVSFAEPLPTDRVDMSPESVQRHYKHSSDELEEYDGHPSFRKNPSFGRLNSDSVGDRDEVIRCTSNASFRRNSMLSRTRTKSRLFDPPEDYRKSGVLKSGVLKSGFLGKASNIDEDDDDPFGLEDLPDDFKKAKFNTFTIIQWVSLILIVTAFVCTLTIPFIMKRRFCELPLWKWELLVLVLICGRLLSGWGIRFIVFFVERNFLLRKRVLYFVYGLRRAVQNCLWLGLVLIAWHFMLDEKVQTEVKNKALPYVTKILFAFLAGNFIWLIKTLLVKVLASSFHVSTFFDRIQESLFNQYVIETLSGPPMVDLRSAYDDEEKVVSELQKLQSAGVSVPMSFRDTFSNMRSGRIIGSGGLQTNSKAGRSFRYSGQISKQQDQGITIDDLHKMNQKNISAWNMKRLMKIVRKGFMSTLDEQIGGVSGEDESAMQIRSEHEAKAAAKKIFNNVSRPRSKHIYLEDLMRFMRDDEAMKTMSLFDGASETNKVSKRALKNWVVNAFRERRALALTLNDTKTAVNKLHHMVNFIVGIIILIVWLLILNIATSRILVVVSSQILLVVFIFGNTCKNIFEAIIFLFVMHPFDVGDRCEIEGVQMIVEEMNIMTTVFLKFDNTKIYYPNSVLSTLPIMNFYRSPDMGESIDFCIHVSTPPEKIAIMKQRIIEYLESHKDHWYPSPMVVVRDVVDMNRLKFSVWMQHTINYQDIGERWTRRAGCVEEMIKIFKELDIEYRMLPIDLNLRNMPALSSNRLPSNWTTCAN